MRQRICPSCPHRGDVLLTHSPCWRQRRLQVVGWNYRTGRQPPTPRTSVTCTIGLCGGQKDQGCGGQKAEDTCPTR
ncbi:Hypothetical protein FKW44_007674 [Caligus rogercresseyi]|uniref:Uncharacterized protein n=1 Tax=Caligus rogercresseyi TaxID=217165 RepID=A0A7T8KF83_CALRO|nr:Hypothetical protein FKW44_007674 [Caligus rogercresseyi]